MHLGAHSPIPNGTSPMAHYVEHLDIIGPAFCSSIDLLEKAIRSIRR